MSLSIQGFDHVALSVSDIAVSVKFYQEVLRLEQLNRPAFSFPGAWFDFGNGQALHLIGRRQEAGNQEHHFALRIDALKEWLQHLASHAVNIKGPRPRPDGIQQIFFNDPDGNLIELDYQGTEQAGAV